MKLFQFSYYNYLLDNKLTLLINSDKSWDLLEIVRNYDEEDGHYEYLEKHEYSKSPDLIDCKNLVNFIRNFFNINFVGPLYNKFESFKIIPINQKHLKFEFIVELFENSQSINKNVHMVFPRNELYRLINFI